jgi:hypothetical protein
MLEKARSNKLRSLRLQHNNGKQQKRHFELKHSGRKLIIYFETFRKDPTLSSSFLGLPWPAKLKKRNVVFAGTLFRPLTLVNT